MFTEADALAEQLQALAGDRQSPSVRHDGVLEAVAQELDVPRAVELALSEGPEAARYLLDVLKVRNL